MIIEAFPLVDVTGGKEVIHRFYQRIPLVFQGLGLVWRSARFWTMAWIVLLFIQGVLPAALVYLTKYLVDGLATALGGGVSFENMRPFLVPGGFMVAILVLERLMSSLATWINTAQSELVQDHIQTLIHEKAVEVDYGFFESPEFYDRLEQANSQAGSRSLALLQNLGGIVQSTITLISISGLLLQYSVLLPVALIVSTIPALFVVVKHNRAYHDWWRRTTPDRRWGSYFNGLMTLRLIAAEVRIFNLGNYFVDRYRSIRIRLRQEHIALVRKQAIATLIAGLMALIIAGITLGWMIFRALRQAASLGDLALFYQAFNRGQSLMRTLLGNVGQIYANTLFLEHLFELLAYQNAVEEVARPEPVPVPLRKGIVLDHITFAYPDSANHALEDFSLFIPAGKIVALVGPNGAGKSTLIKLLCRFYDPQKGSVSLDDIDIRNLSLSALRRQIAIMFQYPVHYQATATDNIRMGDWYSVPDSRRVEKAARGAGAHEFISEMPKGYETLLGRSFISGTELSGGQWQRIALARAFYRDAGIIVLDEPTSAMDSWAENAWLKRFRQLVKNRTALLITHRFTTAMQADIIHVMDEGKIIESGTHDELVASGGTYASSWRAQLRMDDQAVVA